MINNPFDITKAVDYTDQELYDYWVDLNQKKGFNLRNEAYYINAHDYYW